MDSQLYWCKQTNVSLLLRLRLCRSDTGMDRKTLQSPYVLLQDCGSPTLFSLLLSFALNLWVGLNDPCVLGICYPKLGVCTQHHTSGMAQVKCRSQIVTHTWEQEKASLFSLVLFFFFPHPPDDFCISRMEAGRKKRKKKLWNLQFCTCSSNSDSCFIVSLCVGFCLFSSLHPPPRERIGSAVSCNLCA